MRLSDYVQYHVSSTQETHHAPNASSSESSSTVQGTSLVSLEDCVSDDLFSPGHRVFMAAITKTNEPKHFQEAVRIKVWNDAMNKEVVALEDKDTWDIVTLPPNKVAIGS